MATIGRMETSSPPDKNSRYYVQWQLVSQSVANNTSTINWQAGLSITGTDYWYRNAMRIDSGYVDSDDIAPITVSNITTKGDHQFRSGTVTIGHNADGTKSFGAYINGYLYSYGNRTASKSWSLPTIPRATTPSMGTATIGSSVTINLPRASSSFTHRVEYKFGSQSGTIATSAGSSVSWSVPTNLANQIPNATSGTGTLTVTTISGGSTIGTKSIQFTAVLPNTAAFQPDVSGLTVVEGDNSVSNRFTGYVQSRSRLQVNFAAAGVFGSPIRSTSVSFGGKTYDGTDVLTDPIISSGLQTITVSATDSRGRTTTSSQDIMVQPYTPPAVSEIKAYRTNSAGDPDDEGTYATVQMGGMVVALNDENTRVFTLQYRARGDTDWTPIDVTPASGYSLSDTYQLTGIDVDKAYEVALVANDYFMQTTAATSIPTAFTIMDFHADGQGVSFGKVADTSNRMEIGPKLPLHIVAPTSTEADGGFIRLRRADDSLLAFIATGDGGTGLNIHTYDHVGWKGKVSISEDGEIFSNGSKVAIESELPTFTQNVIWSGALYMTNTQTATLSQNISAQKHGIILVWSRYASGAAQDDSWNYIYVPKWHVANFNGAGITCLLGDGSGSAQVRKYVYVSNDHINGNAINDDAPNNAQVLRYVIGY